MDDEDAVRIVNSSGIHIYYGSVKECKREFDETHRLVVGRLKPKENVMLIETMI
ncbi:hypothetical protein [Cellulosilyticum lentocellum]|nr:hypothetical protein [Cellulosilyticum lentocellum]